MAKLAKHISLQWCFEKVPHSWDLAGQSFAICDFPGFGDDG